MHGIMICPAIEVGWLDILLAQQSGYLRTMIDGVVDGLDQHDDDRSLIAPPVKMEDLTQVPLLCDPLAPHVCKRRPRSYPIPFIDVVRRSL